MKHFIYFCMTALFFAVELSSCSNDTPLLKGRWEMAVGQDPTQQGQMDGIEDLVYSMELNFEERTFEPDNELPSGQKSYGWMDFSNASRMYHYDIDSVTVLGDNKYRIVSVDNWMTTNVDTLTYNPKTKEIAYGNDCIFKSVSTVSPSSESNGPSTFLMVLYILLALILSIGAYYLFKVMIGYVFMTLGVMLIGTAVGGLVLWILMGGFDLDLPRWAIITILAVPSVPMAIWGILISIRSTGELASSPFVTKIVKGMKDVEKDRIYVKDETGEVHELHKEGNTYMTDDGVMYYKSGDDTFSKV